MKTKIKGTLIYQNNHIIIAGKKNHRINSDDDISLFLKTLAQGVTADELESLLLNIKLKSLFCSLASAKLLTTFTNAYQNSSMEKTYDFLSYHLGEVDLPFCFNTNLHIAIIGCGGTGANVALCLASSGFTGFTLVDFDTVQESNLNRQFAYDLRDVGQPKTFCLREKLLSINPNLNITVINKKINNTHDLDDLSDDLDFIVSAIDHPAVHSSIFTLKYAIRKNIPIIFGAVGYDRIAAGPLLSNQRAKILYLDALMKVSKIDTHPATGSFSSTNLALCSMLATNITTWFYPFAETPLRNKRKIYNAASMLLEDEVNYGHY